MGLDACILETLGVNLLNIISREEEKRILREAGEDGLVNKTFHDDFDVNQKENCKYNCCKCCYILFQTYYRGIFAFHTITSYIAKLDERECVSCGICVEECPIETIRLVDGKAQDNENKYIGCDVCIHHCPEEARILLRT